MSFYNKETGDCLARTDIGWSDAAATLGPAADAPSAINAAAARNVVYDVVAARLHDAGYSPIPLVGKKTYLNGWPEAFGDARPEHDELSEWGCAQHGHRTYNGVGVACHGGLVVIDDDTTGPVGMGKPSVKDRLRKIGVDIDAAPACRGERNPKYFFRSIDGKNHRSWKISGASTDQVVEVLAHHQQAAVPPSVHPATGKPYVWLDPSCTLENTPLDKLPFITAEDIAAIRREFCTSPTGTGSTGSARPEQQPAAAPPAEDAPTGGPVDHNRWNGNQRELDRIIAALSFIDADPREPWLNVGAAIHYYSSGAPWGHDLWTAWSAGDPLRGFKGSAKFRSRHQQETWAGFDPDKRNPTTIGTVIRLAQKAGFDARRAPRGLPPIDKESLLPPGSHRVLLAASVMPTGPLFHQLREARLLHFLLVEGGTLRQVRLLAILSRYINSSRCFAWPSYGTLARRLCCTIDTVRKIVAELVGTGVIVASDPRTRNAAGAIGPSFAFVPPVGMTWPNLINWDRLEVGHDHDTAWPAEHEKGTAADLDTARTDRGDGGGGSVQGQDTVLPESVRGVSKKRAPAPGANSANPADPKGAPNGPRQGKFDQRPLSQELKAYAADGSIDAWLAVPAFGDAALPADVVEAVFSAQATGSDKGDELAMALRSLRRLRLDDLAIRDRVVSARDDARRRWATGAAKAARPPNAPMPAVDLLIQITRKLIRVADCIRKDIVQARPIPF